jgi:hypothetical protein
VVCIAVIAGVAQGTHDANDLNASNVAAFITKAALGIRSDAGPCDTGSSIRTCFPLYILLLGTFAPALWLMIRKPMLILGCSIAVYLAGRHFGWNLSSSRSAVWYFNPSAWQLLFFLGAWVALGGAAAVQSIVRTRTVVLACDRLPCVCPCGDDVDQLVLCARCHRSEPELALGSDFRWYLGCITHDSSGILRDLA